MFPCRHEWVPNNGKGGEPVCRIYRGWGSEPCLSAQCERCAARTRMSRDEWQAYQSTGETPWRMIWYWGGIWRWLLVMCSCIALMLWTSASGDTLGTYLARVLIGGFLVTGLFHTAWRPIVTFTEARFDQNRS